jgi:hypothetical protein
MLIFRKLTFPKIFDFPKIQSCIILTIINFEIMKNATRIFGAVLFGALLMGSAANAQNKTKDKDKAKTNEKTAATTAAPADANQELLITVTTMHRNMDNKTGTAAEWKALEKEYLDKVVSKNDLIVAQNILTHYFTADNTEIILVSVYKSWNDIEKAGEKDDELVKAAWPDEKLRREFFQKRAAYYGPNHSDEILATYSGNKDMKEKPTKPQLYYVRKSHFAYPKDGTEKEFKDLLTQYQTAVTQKNDFIKAYYPHVHAWGANKTEFTEVFVLDGLADVEKAFDRDDELFKATWTDEAKQKDYDGKFNKYFTGEHGDFLYMSVPELSK